ncbi:cyclic pyranopterin monophosphate synthase MoaC [Candidatus Oleimmundimicrobium sp.]|uniref:cyclic pyranopterin monophosphate synthase MoaC n=1 Tax=Candidatus Oleimmundimicrobium sp. TaxID=3060597 RepID=UPI0027213AFE|nr:cyclic pyranopterin monophosphate synthase MoaC [Candidatus Oleimmundimicrobium sp.]MDO8886884.1 cyclic pyranopterin monophosphate synthase MoaC [Candidatus Oleimmundimicrobium sp.]
MENKRNLTHLGKHGRAKMVDVSEKKITVREAVAKGLIKMEKETLDLIKTSGVKKGDVLAVAQVAGIMGAKKTCDIIPMCHPIQITGVDIDFKIDEKNSSIEILATTKTMDRTGIEMEALTAVAIAALTIYDMCKSVDKTMEIKEIKLVKKSGGRSGTFVRTDG